MQRIFDFLKKTHTFFYATVDVDKPRVRPFGFCMEYEGKFYVGMGKHKECYKQTIANPNIEFCACDSEGKWLRVRGVAVPDDRDEVTAEAFRVAPYLKRIYNDESGLTLGHFYISEGYAEIADMRGHFENFEF